MEKDVCHNSKQVRGRKATASSERPPKEEILIIPKEMRQLQ